MQASELRKDLMEIRQKPGFKSIKPNHVKKTSCIVAIQNSDEYFTPKKTKPLNSVYFLRVGRN